MNIQYIIYTRTRALKKKKEKRTQKRLQPNSH